MKREPVGKNEKVTVKSEALQPESYKRAFAAALEGHVFDKRHHLKEIPEYCHCHPSCD
jgi:hypothetical protein